MNINYHESADGTHIFEVTNETGKHINSTYIGGALRQIYHNSHDKPTYILLDLSGLYHLPLREFVAELKRFYGGISASSVLIALVLQPALLNVVETMVKTLVTRETIQNFTTSDLALMWLSIERKKRQSK